MNFKLKLKIGFGDFEPKCGGNWVEVLGSEFLNCVFLYLGVVV